MSTVLLTFIIVGLIVTGITSAFCAISPVLPGIWIAAAVAVVRIVWRA